MFVEFRATRDTKIITSKLRFIPPPATPSSTPPATTQHLSGLILPPKCCEVHSRINDLQNILANLCTCRASPVRREVGKVGIFAAQVFCWVMLTNEWASSSYANTNSLQHVQVNWMNITCTSSRFKTWQTSHATMKCRHFGPIVHTPVCNTIKSMVLVPNMYLEAVHVLFTQDWWHLLILVYPWMHPWHLPSLELL